MAKVLFWGTSFAQLQSLPLEVRSALARAILRLEAGETLEPSSEEDDLFAEPMRGASGLYRITVGSGRRPPGYRAVYYVFGGAVYFVRFRHRDPSTYRGIRDDLDKLRSELTVRTGRR